MRKTIYMIIAIFLLSFMLSSFAAAEEDSLTFSFSLTVDGKETKEVNTGDIVTVTLRLSRTDETNPYMMYAMQDELRYDSDFLEIIEPSTVLKDGVVTKDIATSGRYREFYINYLSMSGGTLWEKDTMVGSVQFKVIGSSGVSRITNQDYLVSYQNGQGSYLCDAEDIMLILSTDCTVVFMSNGGSEIPTQTVQYGEKVVCPKDPIREGYRFAGWYKDIEHIEEWNFESDVVQENMSLYAKWDLNDEEDSFGYESRGNAKCPFYVLFLILLLCVLYFLCRKLKNKKKNLK